jgi:hypothetical protein
MKKIIVTIMTLVTDEYYMNKMTKIKQDMQDNTFQTEMENYVGIEECTATFEELKQEEQENG